MKHDTIRIIEILNKMKSGEMIKANTIAAELCVSLRTAQRDIKEIENMGFKMESKVGKAGGYMLTLDSQERVKDMSYNEIALIVINKMKEVC